MDIQDCSLVGRIGSKGLPPTLLQGCRMEGHCACAYNFLVPAVTEAFFNCFNVVPYLSFISASFVWVGRVRVYFFPCLFVPSVTYIGGFCVLFLLWPYFLDIHLWTNSFPQDSLPRVTTLLTWRGVTQYCLRDGRFFQRNMNYRRLVLLGSLKVEAGTCSCN